MYGDTVTIFNRWRGAGGDIWYPTVLRGVNLCRDRAALARKYGSESGDRALLNVRYEASSDGSRTSFADANLGGRLPAATAASLPSANIGEMFVGGKRWLSPRVWRALDEAARAETVTFSAEEMFDFFIPGEWDGGIVHDADYDRDGGFYGCLNRTRDDVFAVTGVDGPFVLIPHFEVTGK